LLLVYFSPLRTLTDRVNTKLNQPPIPLRSIRGRKSALMFLIFYRS
jgi:hypothetical protein